jgi:multidrug efflux pump subunit AcrB
MEQVSNDFVRELKKRPELGSAFTFYSASFPQYMLKVDNDLAEQKGVTIEKAMDNLSTLIGSNYETSFIRFDRPYKVIVQAGPQYRALPSDLLKLYVKNDKDQMVPYSDFMHLEKVYGLSEITRHNMYNSSEVVERQRLDTVPEMQLKRFRKWRTKRCQEVSESIGQGFQRRSFQRNEAIYIFLVCLDLFI